MCQMRNDMINVLRVMNSICLYYPFRQVEEGKKYIMYASNGQHIIIYLFPNFGTLDIYQIKDGVEKQILLSMNPDNDDHWATLRQTIATIQ